HAEELAGEDATFKVTVHEVKTKELPELDDEFAKDVDDEVETLEELRTKKKEELTKQKEQDADNQMRESLVTQASDNATVDIPEAMVTTEVEQMVKEFEQRLQQQGMTMEMYFQFSGQDEEAFKEQMRGDAEKRVKTNLTLEAIFNEENLDVTDEEVEEEISKMAGMYNVEVDQIKQMLGGNTAMMKEDLKFKKAIDFLVENHKSA